MYVIPKNMGEMLVFVMCVGLDQAALSDLGLRVGESNQETLNYYYHAFSFVTLRKQILGKKKGN